MREMLTDLPSNPEQKMVSSFNSELLSNTNYYQTDYMTCIWNMVKITRDPAWSTLLKLLMMLLPSTMPMNSSTQLKLLLREWWTTWTKLLIQTAMLVFNSSNFKISTFLTSTKTLFKRLSCKIPKYLELKTKENNFKSICKQCKIQLLFQRIRLSITLKLKPTQNRQKTRQICNLSTKLFLNNQLHMQYWKILSPWLTISSLSTSDHRPSTNTIKPIWL